MTTAFVLSGGGSLGAMQVRMLRAGDGPRDGGPRARPAHRAQPGRSHLSGPGRVELHIVAPLCSVWVLPIDFSHSDELVARADNANEQWLAGGRTAAPPGTRRLGEPGPGSGSGQPDETGGAGATTRPQRA
jgi:hypothetical protein